MKQKTITTTPHGPIVILWDLIDGEAKITRVHISTPSVSAFARVSKAFPAGDESSCAQIDKVASGITKLLAGDKIEFPLEIADLCSCGEFQRRVLRAEHAIPRGSVSTYKLIAAHLGVPGGARAVGNALADNPFPLIIPCHRAIRSDHTLGGYQGGLEMKRALLTHEGVAFDGAGKVKCLHFHYE